MSELIKPSQRLIPLAQNKIIYFELIYDSIQKSQLKVNRDSPPIHRFFSKLIKTFKCWEWTGGKFSDNYGAISLNGKTLKAHRYSYLIHNGGLDESLLVCHHCDNPSCVNPAHLFQGSTQDNTQDRDLKGRTAKGEHSGARLHPETHARGESQGSAVLTEAEVKLIRKLYSNSYYYGIRKDLALRFNVSTTQISNIVKKLHWSHVE